MGVFLLACKARGRGGEGVQVSHLYSLTILWFSMGLLRIS